MTEENNNTNIPGMIQNVMADFLGDKILETPPQDCPFRTIEEYCAHYGHKRFRMLKVEKERGMSREEALQERIVNFKPGK